MLKAKLDTSKTQAALARRVPLFRDNARQEMMDIGRLVAVSCATSTQPYGVSESSRKNGEAAVHRDIYKIYCTPGMVYGEIANSDVGAAKSFYKAFRSGDYLTAISLIHAYAPKFNLVQIQQFDNGKLHKERRNRRGRVSKAQKNISLVTNPRALQRYVAAEKAKVGYAKAGWANCARAFREGRAGTRGLPGWVTRHRGAPASAAVNVGAGNLITLVMRNNVEYAQFVLTPAAKAEAVGIGLYRFRQGAKIAAKKASQQARI